MWLGKFMARANKKGYRDILNGTAEVPKQTTTLDPINSKDTKKIEMWKANQDAFDNILMSLEDRISLGKVQEATMKYLPYGDAELAWSRLIKKFKPSISATRVELMLNFVMSKLKMT